MRNGSRGFTLIELMIVIAIVGILSSVAIPSYQNYQLRTKQAERAVITRAIKTSLEDYMTRHDQYPNGSAAASWMSGPYSPALPPVSYKRPLVMTGDWPKLNLLIQGNVFYSYLFYAYRTSNSRYSYVLRRGDLDGDGATNYSYEYWPSSPQLVNGKVVWVESFITYDDWYTTKTF